MGLLDRENQKYIIQWDDASQSLHGIINNPEGKLIGKFNSVGILRKKIILFDIDKSVILIVSKSINALNTKYTIQDSNKTKLGNVGIIGFLKNVWVLRDDKGKLIIKVNRFDGIYDFHEFNTLDDESVADVGTDMNRKDVEFEYRSTLEINNLDFNRKLIFGLVLAILGNRSDVSPSD